MKDGDDKDHLHRYPHRPYYHYVGEASVHRDTSNVKSQVGPIAGQ